MPVFVFPTLIQRLYVLYGHTIYLYVKCIYAYVYTHVLYIYMSYMYVYMYYILRIHIFLCIYI